MPDRYVSVRHCSIVLGISWREAQRDLYRLRWAFRPRPDGRYDPRVLDLLRALRAQPHRALEPVHQDWLARYLKETHEHPEPPRPPDT